MIDLIRNVMKVVSAMSLTSTTIAAMPGIYGTDTSGPDLQLAHLYTVKIKPGPPIEVGAGPRGNRVVYPIGGGEFEGPLIKGKVLPIGGDYALFDSNRFMTLDVRQTFQTDDGALIQVFETGRTQPGAGLGANITTAYVQLAFETGAADYAWINQAVAVGVLHRLHTGSISIDVWVLAPLRSQVPDGSDMLAVRAYRRAVGESRRLNGAGSGA
ncbi:hypothetical protein MCOR25_003849 [Pyricularia grisea]|uniref:Uncharacterized protein n=1 Tax=Pyricularia grisea TaxID=148305 RepID=A0A6P8BJH5_PYRGI|nr:uncharacterized protein PgNI_00521 [Pyricularia grisea]KAI6372114.1 hypothetical protein MCOR25_003849 [Pyricularia grisea]TLD16727.1 hypothetical protein PgNI_00521 [Pyricularia grisea]